MGRKKLYHRKLVLQVSEQEYQHLQHQYRHSLSPKFPAFCRDLLFSRPVIMRYHNVAADEFLIIALDLKRELEEVIDNLRLTLASPSNAPDGSLALLIAKVDELKFIMHLIHQQWSSM